MGTYFLQTCSYPVCQAPLGEEAVFPLTSVADPLVEGQMVTSRAGLFWVPAILCVSVGFREHHDILVAVSSLQVVLAAQDNCEYLDFHGNSRAVFLVL